MRSSHDRSIRNSEPCSQARRRRLLISVEDRRSTHRARASNTIDWPKRCRTSGRWEASLASLSTRTTTSGCSTVERSDEHRDRSGTGYSDRRLLRHAPAMIHFDKAGNVIESFDAPQGLWSTTGLYLYRAEYRRKMRPKRQDAGSHPHIPETANGQPFDSNPRIGWTKARAAGPVAGFITVPGAEGRRGGRSGRGGSRRRRWSRDAGAAAAVSLHRQYRDHADDRRRIKRSAPTMQSMKVIADSSCGGRVMVFSPTSSSSSGLGAYGQTVEIARSPRTTRMRRVVYGRVHRPPHLQFLQRRIGLCGRSWATAFTSRTSRALQAEISWPIHRRGQIDQRRVFSNDKDRSCSMSPT